LNLIYNNGRFIDVLVFPLNKLNPEAKGWKQKKRRIFINEALSIIVSCNYFKDDGRIWCGGLENVSFELPLIGT
jgi:hypothetical protein